jgi:hypothetical protein
MMWRGDQAFFVLLEAVASQCPVLTDLGFRSAGGEPEQVVLCLRGQHPERRLVETVLSLLTRICGLKQLQHHSKVYLSAHLGYVAVVYNSLLHLVWQDHEEWALTIAQFSLWELAPVVWKLTTESG